MQDTPNSAMLQAMQETEEILKHPERYRGYDNVEELFHDIEVNYS